MTVSVSAIVPIYNEEKFLKESVNNLLKVNEIEKIFLVDDCSTDNSKSIMEHLNSKYEKIEIFETSMNGGKGKAILTMQNHLKTDYVIIHDADLEYSPLDIPNMIKSINTDNFNLVLGSRFINKNKKQIYLRTFIANKLLSKIFSIIYRVNVTDIATCYKLMPTSYFKNEKFLESGFAIEVELLAKYFNKNKNYKEVPISYKARSYEEGKKIKLLDGFKYLFAMFKYRFY